MVLKDFLKVCGHSPVTSEPLNLSLIKKTQKYILVNTHNVIYRPSDVQNAQKVKLTSKSIIWDFKLSNNYYSIFSFFAAHKIKIIIILHQFPLNDNVC